MVKELTPDEVKELQQLQAMEAQESAQSDLTPEEQQELISLRQMEERSQNVGTTDSLLRGAAQGLTFGGADEIAGAVGAAGEVLFGETPLSDVANAYKEHRNESRDNFKIAESANPGAFTTGDIAGSIATAFVPGLGSAKLLQAGKTLGTSIKAGVATGALSGFGRSEGEEIAEYARDISIGAATGVIGGTIGYGAGKVLSKPAVQLSEKIDDIANKSYAEALGISGVRDARQLEKFLVKNNKMNLKKFVDLISEDSLEQLDDGTIAVLKDSPIGEKIIGFGQTYDDVGQKIVLAKDTYGKQLSKILSRADDALPEGLDTGSISARLKSEIVDPLLRSDVPEEQEMAKKALEYIDSMLTVSDGKGGAMFKPNFSISKLHDLRKGVDRTIRNFDKQIAVDTMQGIRRNARGVLEEQIEDAVDTVIGKGVLDDGTIGAYQLAKQKWGAYNTLEEIMSRKVDDLQGGAMSILKKSINLKGQLAAQNVNPSSPSAIGSLGIGAAINGVLGSQRLPSALAVSLKKVSNGLITGGAKWDSLAQKVVRGASISNAALGKALGLAEATIDLSEKPLDRSVEAVKLRKSQILNVLDEQDVATANALRQAIESDDDDTIMQIMSQVSQIPAARKFVQPGMGWDGKAVTLEEKEQVVQQVKNLTVPPSIKKDLIKKFNKDAIIPPMEEIQATIAQNRQARQPSRGARDLSGKRQLGY